MGKRSSLLRWYLSVYTLPTYPLSPTSLSYPDQTSKTAFCHGINSLLPEQQAKEADEKSFTSSAPPYMCGARDLLDSQPVGRRTFSSEICTQICPCTRTFCKPGFQGFHARQNQNPQAMYQKDERSYPSHSVFTKTCSRLSSNFQLRE